MTKSYNEIAQILAEKDPIIKKVIASVNEIIKPTPSIDIYLSLLNSIVSQQLSVKVVSVIWKRFTDLFPDAYPQAEEVLQYDDSTLRAIGLSNSKVKYIKNVAQFSLTNDISFANLDGMSDDEIIAYLTQIKGVGKWTVQMILMFPMDRSNVFPVDDLGIQTRIKFWYALDLDKKELKNEMFKISEKWSPYKTLASKYLWKSVIKPQ